jgi:predicted AAA+ superfamily ATPase
VRRLDEPAQREIALADPDAVLSGEAPVLIDEWQRVPATWDAVKRQVDADPTGGRFLLTGSAATEGPTHSGAGRIASCRWAAVATFPAK